MYSIRITRPTIGIFADRNLAVPLRFGLHGFLGFDATVTSSLGRLIRP